MLDKSFSSENIVLGIGSYTYQMVTRDTWGWAMKATYGEINGEGRPIFKDPVTDDGVKKSHLGLLHVDKETGIVTQDVSWEQFRDTSNALRPVWRDGMMIAGCNFDEVRARAQSNINKTEDLFATWP